MSAYRTIQSPPVHLVECPANHLPADTRDRVTTFLGDLAVVPF